MLATTSPLGGGRPGRRVPLLLLRDPDPRRLPGRGHRVLGEVPPESLEPNAVAMPRQNFDKACHCAVASRVRLRTRWGGSIHENYELMLLCDFAIVDEHDFRVRHCLLTRLGLDADNTECAISHQATSRC